MPLESLFLRRSQDLIQHARQITVTNHVGPDGDAMGSALATAGVLQARFPDKSIYVLVPNQVPPNLHWMEGYKQVINFEADPERGRAVLRESQLCIHLDYNALSRAGSLEEDLQKFAGDRLVIDHHREPEDFAQAIYSDPAMSSTCEMVYHWLSGIGLETYLSPGTAEALYAGIVTDTGNFRYSSTTSSTHRIAAQLLEQGVAPHRVATRIFDTQKLQRFRLLGRALERLYLHPEAPAAIISLTEDDVAQNDFEKGDTEGFVNYGLSLEGIELSVFCYPWDGKVKMSFRSKSGFDVNSFARKYFQGGGHFNAAGGISELSVAETWNLLHEKIANHAPQLLEFPHFED